MGFMDKLRNEFVDIIEWLDDSRSTLAWRFPRYNNEIKNGAELIVREGQEAVFVYRGQLADRFGPGHYQLTSENLPIMSTLQGWKHGFNSPFRSEVYFINTRPVTDLRWGTANPVTVRDPDFKMVQVRANGLCVVRVIDAAIFLRQVIGTDASVDIDEIAELLRRVITLAFSDMIMETRLGVIDLQGRQVQLAEQLRAFTAERVDDEYGLAIDSITLNISLPEEITQAMTRGVARGVEESGWVNNLGDMQRYQQAKAADAMSAAAGNPGGSGMMGDMLGAQMGMMLGQQMNQQMQPGYGQGQQGGFPGYPQGGTPAAPPPPLPTAVTYHVDQGGQATGPFNVQQLQQALSAGQLTASTLVWSQGMAGWTPAGQVPALAGLFAEPPPLPGTPPPPPPNAGSPS
ncbi:SPFH domain-containing protein [Granulicoccus sp. GXG6511]|uniref:SPFH domain-containing protein n=1 Tax=Granulicoccus sp. GXG6511 TaxID=3381351 RepID=UPI003D7CAF45